VNGNSGWERREEVMNGRQQHNNSNEYSYTSGEGVLCKVFANVSTQLIFNAEVLYIETSIKNA
jgi:hypothetical protein